MFLVAQGHHKAGLQRGLTCLVPPAFSNVKGLGSNPAGDSTLTCLRADVPAAKTCPRRLFPSGGEGFIFMVSPEAIALAQPLGSTLIVPQEPREPARDPDTHSTCVLAASPNTAKHLVQNSEADSSGRFRHSPVT